MACLERFAEIACSLPPLSSVREEFTSAEVPSDPKNGITVLPGLVDVHVHLREPGFLYKETVASGTLAAAAGGYVAVCPMPNVSPVPDSLSALGPTLAAIEKDAVVRVYPYGSITRGERGEEVADLSGIAPYVVGFSDDGVGLEDASLMKEAMTRAAALGKPVAAHCEDLALRAGGYINDGQYARLHGHRGISAESEWRQIERDLALARETGVSYHVCHVSTKQSVALIRAAKAEGVDVTCETAPHYLVLSDADLREDGDFKMNPPLRSESDRLALIEGLLDGTVDMIATDHAPHSVTEKSRGLRDSLMGVVGLETAFPVLYTKLVLGGVLPLSRLVELMSGAPARRFRIPLDPENDWAVWDLSEEYTVDPDAFKSKGRSTPFKGMSVFGKCKMTVCGGRAVWREPGFDPSFLFGKEERE
ncbi:MAG: dihydroorotase [Clostridia bacterium]|nr:dihydroorotase [Clostridia bacterium]